MRYYGIRFQKDYNDDGRASFFPVGYYSTVYLQTVSHFLIFGLGTLFNCLPLFRFSLPLRCTVLLFIDISFCPYEKDTTLSLVDRTRCF